MGRKASCILMGIALAAGSYSCADRKTEDRVSQGVEGPTSPRESGQHGAEASTRLEREQKDALYRTAGLNGELTNGKVDETMEGSGNLAWQGSYYRERRAKLQAQAAVPAEQSPQARP